MAKIPVAEKLLFYNSISVEIELAAFSR